MEKKLRESFAEFISKTSYRKLPKDVILQAKRCILDFLGVTLAGSKMALPILIANIVCDAEGSKEATIIGHGRKTSSLKAVLLNGVSGHALDMDDGHRYANGHPGAVIVPAAVALGEREDATGKKFIEAIVVAYETFIRIATWINPSHLQKGFHTTGTVGPFAAAAASSKLLDLNKGEIENALAIAGLQGSGLLEVTTSGQMMKPFQAGKAAQAGVLASLLAQKGATGPDLIFEGEKGFIRAYSDLRDCQKFVADLVGNFEILNTYFKLHAACRHVHSSLDAVKEIMDGNEIDTSEIKRITVYTYSVAYQLTGRNREAKTELAAKFSLPVSIGLMLVYGKAGVDEYSLECITNPAVQKLAKKVDIVVDRERDDMYPSKRSSQVDIEVNGAVYTHEVDIPKGDPENPCSDDELREKFLINAARVLPMERTGDLYRSVFDIEKCSVRELMKFVY